MRKICSFVTETWFQTWPLKAIFRWLWVWFPTHLCLYVCAGRHWKDSAFHLWFGNLPFGCLTSALWQEAATALTNKVLSLTALKTGRGQDDNDKSVKQDPFCLEATFSNCAMWRCHRGSGRSKLQHVRETPNQSLSRSFADASLLTCIKFWSHDEVDLMRLFTVSQLILMFV